MSKIDIIRAWKDEEFRENLQNAAALPAHPSGNIELDDEALNGVRGGMLPPEGTNYTGLVCTLGCCIPTFLDLCSIGC